MSEVLVLGLSDDNGNIVLITPDSAVPVGAKLH
jgi:tRNA-binding protein